MRTMQLGNSDLIVPVVAVGCMRINSVEMQVATQMIHTALDLGANFFDHADIYGGGQCESIFAQAADMNSSMRARMILQTKCGIRPGMYDFSKEHIINSVENSLQRLKTDYVDVLLLHRPDALMEPEEVAAAFDALQSAGKVKYFGVSNQKPMQIELLQKYVRQPLVANQLQLSVTHSTMIDSGINVNTQYDGAVDRDGSILDYCRLHNITIQPWSPFQYGFFAGVYLDNPEFPEVNRVIDAIAEKYGVSNTTIVIAWLLRHPAKMQPVSGTMNPSRFQQICQAADITLTREEWYQIYLSAGNTLP